MEAATAWRVRLLTLGMLFRRVTVDPRLQTLTVDSRYAWLFARRRKIPFAKIAAITYGYSNLSPDSYVSWGHDSFDSFTVGLRLKTPDQEIHLFNFVGEGTFSNDGPLPDWMYWQEFTYDWTGSQEKESRLFVDVLSTMVGVKVVPPRVY